MEKSAEKHRKQLEMKALESSWLRLGDVLNSLVLLYF